jgi:hypothetical protein
MDYFEKAGVSIYVQDEDRMNQDKLKMTECITPNGDITLSLLYGSVRSSCIELILQECGVVKFV